MIAAIAASLGVDPDSIAITDIADVARARRLHSQIRLLEMSAAVSSMDGVSSPVPEVGDMHLTQAQARLLFSSAHSSGLHDVDAAYSRSMQQAQAKRIAELHRLLQTSSGVTVTYQITIVTQSLTTTDSSVKNDPNAAYTYLLDALTSALTPSPTTGTSAFLSTFLTTAAAAGGGTTFAGVTASSNIQVSAPIIIVLSTPEPSSPPTSAPTEWTSFYGSWQMGLIFGLGGFGSIIILAWVGTYYLMPLVFGYKRRPSSITSWRYASSLNVWRKADPLSLIRSKKSPLASTELDGQHTISFQHRSRLHEDAANYNDPARRRTKNLRDLQAAAAYGQQQSGRASMRPSGAGVKVPRRAEHGVGYDDQGFSASSRDDGNSDSDSGFSGFESNSGWDSSSTLSFTGTRGQQQQRQQQEQQAAAAAPGLISAAVYSVATLGGLVSAPAYPASNKKPATTSSFSSDEESTRRTRGVFRPSAVLDAQIKALREQAARRNTSQLPPQPQVPSRLSASSSDEYFPSGYSEASPGRGEARLEEGRARLSRGPSPPPASDWPKKGSRPIGTLGRLGLGQGGSSGSSSGPLVGDDGSESSGGVSIGGFSSGASEGSSTAAPPPPAPRSSSPPRQAWPTKRASSPTKPPVGLMGRIGLSSAPKPAAPSRAPSYSAALRKPDEENFEF